MEYDEMVAPVGMDAMAFPHAAGKSDKPWAGGRVDTKRSASLDIDCVGFHPEKRSQASAGMKDLMDGFENLRVDVNLVSHHALECPHPFATILAISDAHIIAHDDKGLSVSHLTPYGNSVRSAPWTWLPNSDGYTRDGLPRTQFVVHGGHTFLVAVGDVLGQQGLARIWNLTSMSFVAEHRFVHVLHDGAPCYLAPNALAVTKGHIVIISEPGEADVPTLVSALEWSGGDFGKSFSFVSSLVGITHATVDRGGKLVMCVCSSGPALLYTGVPSFLWALLPTVSFHDQFGTVSISAGMEMDVKTYIMCLSRFGAPVFAFHSDSEEAKTLKLVERIRAGVVPPLDFKLTFITVGTHGDILCVGPECYVVMDASRQSAYRDIIDEFDAGAICDDGSCILLGCGTGLIAYIGTRPKGLRPKVSLIHADEGASPDVEDDPYVHETFNVPTEHMIAVVGNTVLTHLCGRYIYTASIETDVKCASV
jgi:hypothetical protein